jgi:hypothetical protein
MPLTIGADWASLIWIAKEVALVAEEPVGSPARARYRSGTE